jgi:hypothetical protein
MHGGGGHMGGNRVNSPVTSFRGGKRVNSPVTSFNRGFRGGRGRFFSNGAWYWCTPYAYEVGICPYDY